MMGLWRWVEEEGGRVVLCDRGEAGRRPPPQRQRARGAQTGFQVIFSNWNWFRVSHSMNHVSLNKSCFFSRLHSRRSVHFSVSVSVSCVTSRWCWFSVAQLWWGFSEGERELPDREGAVAAASLLRVWRYAWPLESINNSSIKCDSGRKDYYGRTDFIVWRWPLVLVTWKQTEDFK